MIGLVNVTQMVAQARDLQTVLSTFFVDQGMEPYTNTAAAGVAGTLLTVSAVVCLVLAINFAVRRLRQRRRAFWVPLVCAVISVAVTTVVIGGAVASDPAFSAYLQSMS